MFGKKMLVRRESRKLKLDIKHGKSNGASVVAQQRKPEALGTALWGVHHPSSSPWVC